VTDTEATREVIKRFYAAIAGWDEDELRAVVHQDAELHQPPTLPYGGVYRGLEEMMPLWKNIVLPSGDKGNAYVDSMIVEGDRAVVIAGNTRDGKPSLACEDYLVRDGQIVRIRMFWFDPTPVVEAVVNRGLVESRP
jgi:ketosteroid isomerase-like protein